MQSPIINFQSPTSSRALVVAQAEPRIRRVHEAYGTLKMAYGAFLLFFLFAPALLAQSTNTLPALAPAYGEIPPTLWERFGLAIVILVTFLVVTVAVIVWLALRPRTPYVLPASVQARIALLGLQARTEDGTVLTAVSQNLRRYLVAVYSLPDHEMTTTEFCTLIANNQQIGPSLAEAIGDFLRECDQRKFAPEKSAAPVNAAVRAIDFTNKIEKHQMSLVAPNETAPPPVKA